MKWASEEFAREAERAFVSFQASNPSWDATAGIDALRSRDYARLDREHHVYLDYTGGGLYAPSQLAAHREILEQGVFGNPHSNNPTSLAMTERVESARRAVLEHFNASPEEYFAIFTQNASGALKLIGESYPFEPGGRYLLTYDNHNSVNGIREYARARGAAVTYVPVHRPDLRIDRDELATLLDGTPHSPAGLFAFPAQSNFSGVQHPLELIEEAHDAGWNVLLDAAAFVPTNRLDLGRWKPDFVCASFYKMFGYPTGVGCLLMKKSMFPLLRRPWFAGGTVQIVSVQGGGHYLATDAAAFEDGTVDYLSLPAVELGLRHLQSVGIDAIHERTACLTGFLLDTLGGLRHRNGAPLAVVHGPSDCKARGGTIAFNFSDPEGAVHDIRRIQELANESHISLRTGCFCNPGAGEVAFDVPREQIAEFFVAAEGIGFEELRTRMRARYGREIGAVRISVGLASNFLDVFRFADFARAFLDRSVAEVGSIDPIAGEVGWMRDSA